MNKISKLGIPKVRALSISKIKPVKALGLQSNNFDEDYTNHFYGLEKGEGIDFPKLIRYLQSYSKEKLNYNSFKGTPVRERKAVSRYGVVETGKEINKTIAFKYVNEYKQEVETSIDCGINKKRDYISNVPNFSLYVNFREKKIHCVLSYFYLNTEKYRQSVINTTSESDFVINDKYIGVKLFSNNISDMSHLVRHIQKVKSNEENFWYETLVNKAYIPLLEKAGSKEELIWLYENAADFTLRALKPEQLWKHICEFYNYDTKGIFSYFKDASLPLIRALFAFNTPDRISFLMRKLNDNQEFVKNIYDALDGTMLFEGKEQKLQTIFSSLITGFCFTDISTLHFTNEIFYVGKDYFVNVKNANENNEAGKYWVEQRYKSETYYVDSGTAIIEMGGEQVLTSRIKLNPLDIVTLLQKDTDSLLFVPILFLKDIDHQKDLENLMTAIRIGVDILAIALTISTLGGASPLLAVAGALEIGLSVADIAVMTYKDKLSEEFLKTWEKIYIISGLATASPVVVSSLYKLGGKILVSSAKTEMKNFVQSCMMKMLLESEISNFSKNTLKIANEQTIAKASEFFFDKYSFKAFWENGCQLAYGEVKLGNTINNEIALVYNGVPIIQGGAREIKPQLMKLYSARYNKTTLTTLLENLYKLTPKLNETKKYWTCFNEFGTEMKWLNQQAKTVNLTDDINKALKSNDPSKVWVGEIAQELGIENITNFNNKFLQIKDGKIINDLGDLDVGTVKYFIEAKKSISQERLLLDMKDIKEQINKYYNPKEEKFINLWNKPVILAVKEFTGGANIYTKEIQDLLREYKNLKIIVGKNNIKTLK